MKAFTGVVLACFLAAPAYATDPQFGAIRVEVSPNVRHAFVSAQSQSANANLVSKNEWNAAHTVPTALIVSVPTGIVWPAMPAAVTEFCGASTAYRWRADLTNQTSIRLTAQVVTAGPATSALRLQYTLDTTGASGWGYLDSVSGPSVSIADAGVTTSATVSIATAAKAEVLLRLVGINGDGAGGQDCYSAIKATGLASTLAIANGGTGQTSASAAVDALGGASSTGTGGLVRATSPTLVTPVLGAATGTSIDLTGAATVEGGVNYCLDAVGTDSYACSLSPAITAYSTGTVYAFKAGAANTGAATLNLNAIGAQAIVKTAGGVTTVLADNDIRSGSVVQVAWDGTNFQLVSPVANAVSSTITSGTTATSGCVAGGVLRSISNLVECGAGLTYNGTAFGLSGDITATASGVGMANKFIGYSVAPTAYNIRFSNEFGATNGTVISLGTDANTTAAHLYSAPSAPGAYLAYGRYPGVAGTVAGGQLKIGATEFSLSFSGGASLATVFTTSSTGTTTLNNGANAVSPLVVQDNGTPVLTVADGGATTFASQITTNGGINLGNQNLTSAGGYIKFTSNVYGVTFLASDITAAGIFRSETLTPDSWTFGTNALSESIHIAQRPDYTYDFNNGPCGTSACTDPTLIVHSAVQDTTQYNATAAWGQAGGAVKALTESAATALVRIPVANNSRASGEIVYEIYATDGTDMQTRTSRIRYAMSNKAGTETCTLTAMDGVVATAETDDDNASDITAGTLTYGIACTNNAANTMDITFNAVSSLTQTTLQATWSVKHLSPGAPARQ